MKAIRSVNRGKSADYHGLTIEHIDNAGKDMENLLLVITNEIFRQGKVPETLKVRLLTPIFKNKGLKSQATKLSYGAVAIIQQSNSPIVRQSDSPTVGYSDGPIVRQML